MYQRETIRRPGNQNICGFSICPARTLLFILLLWAAVPAKGGTAQEYAVKAAFLVSFAEFVEWPGESDAVTGPIIIGIIGPDPFGGALDAIVATKNKPSVRYVIQRYGRMEDISRCHILFVGLPGGADTTSLIAYLADRPVLTVGETDSFIKSGGMINFFIDGDRVRFEISKVPAERAGLTISAKLLRLQKKADR